MSTIFVFGSNLAGRHGRGAALDALKLHGAEYGVGRGPTGFAYAIPTKDAMLRRLSLAEINVYVLDFIIYAKINSARVFNVTRVGCGLAGYTDADIAPMFKDAPANCVLPEGWR